MVLSEIFGNRRLPLTQLTPLVLTPLLTSDDLLSLSATNAENYWVLALATLKARWHATVRRRQCLAEAEEQALEERQLLQQQVHDQREAILLAARLADETGDALRRYDYDARETMHRWQSQLEDLRNDAEQPIDDQYLAYLQEGRAAGASSSQ